MVSAEDLVEGDYTYTVANGKEAFLKKYTGAGGAITTPSTLGGYPTTWIEDYAFTGSSVTSVIIPDSVTNIQNAFGSCKSLTSVTIGNGVINIASGAFGQCTSLTAVTIPNSVNYIGDYAFAYDSSLATVTIGSGVTVMDSPFRECSSLTSISFLGLVAPEIRNDNMWIYGTPNTIRGHAYAASNFPAPGEEFHGLTMGTVLTVSSENEPPVALFSWMPSTPTINQQVTFDASASSDPDGSITVYEWDWNNDGTYEDDSDTPTATHSWTQAGSYPVKLQVTDNDSSTSTKTITIPVSSGGGGGNGNTNDKGTPGFELVVVIGAIAVTLLLWRKKRNI
jgi:hypothetical protein